MAEPYTPTTDEIRSLVGEGYATTFADDRSIGEVKFDRWLAEVRREAWDEVADYLDRTNAPSIAEAARRDNPHRKDIP